MAAYLASQAWTQAEIGLALSVGTVTFMVSQVPAGAVVDAARSKRRVAAAAVVAIVASALLLALFPARLPVFTAEVLHGLASCVLTPAIAALSLAAAGGASGNAFGERLGRNSRFSSIGAGVAAGLMGAVGYWVSERSVFLLAAALALPAMFSLRLIAAEPVAAGPPEPRQPLSGALMDRRLLLFAGCCFGFQLANAGMFPFAAVRLTRQAGSISELGDRRLPGGAAIAGGGDIALGRAVCAAARTAAGPAARLRRRAAAGRPVRPGAAAGPGRGDAGIGRRQRGGVRRAAAAGGGGHHARHGAVQPMQWARSGWRSAPGRRQAPASRASSPSGSTPRAPS
ncbi:MAG: MFS transporter [Acetobacteraceae bacterium]